MAVLTRCWRNWSTGLRPTGGSGPAGAREPRHPLHSKRKRSLRLERPEAPGLRRSALRDDDFAVLDADQVHVRHALAAFLAFRTGLVELDLAVHTGQLDLPEGGADRLGVGLAGLLDRRRDGADAVIAAIALGDPGELEAALLPFLDELARHVRVWRRFRRPGREGRKRQGAVRRRARLLDQLVRVLRAAGRDDALLQAQRRRLLEDQRQLLDRGRDHERVGIGVLDLVELRAHVLRGLVHGLDEADLDALRLVHLAEVVGGAAAPVVVDDEEVDLLDAEPRDLRSEGLGLDRGGRRDAEDVGVA